MGLDMIAFVTAEDIPAVDFPDPADAKAFHYWRKHPNLHGWMQRLYEQRGGRETFNCVPIKLDADDINALEQALRDDSLPFTEGFFFGQSTPDDRQQDEEFIRKARDALSKGNRVYYTSWW